MKLRAARHAAAARRTAVTSTRRTTGEKKLKQLLGRETVASIVHAAMTAMTATSKRIVLLRGVSDAIGAMNVVDLLLLRIRENRIGFTNFLECCKE